MTPLELTCPSPNAWGRTDRCGLLATPRRCSTVQCTAERASRGCDTGNHDFAARSGPVPAPTPGPVRDSMQDRFTPVDRPPVRRAPDWLVGCLVVVVLFGVMWLASALGYWCTGVTE